MLSGIQGCGFGIESPEEDDVVYPIQVRGFVFSCTAAGQIETLSYALAVQAAVSEAICLGLEIRGEVSCEAGFVFLLLVSVFKVPVYILGVILGVQEI